VRAGGEGGAGNKGGEGRAHGRTVSRHEGCVRRVEREAALQRASHVSIEEHAH